ncbi:hypothetical protein FOZ62_024473 [Perkinsus olseni]|uniref:Uncharacterized protein n=1 Tax=Perkinsus olseni TaxID=32597 RepID=A0A7J6TEF6_PEROL|nr:hypothetical protein FOZ62_024473 [Perkinsus olseni]
MGNRLSTPSSGQAATEGIFRGFTREYSSPDCSWRCDLHSRLPTDQMPPLRQLTASVSASVKVPANCPAGITMEAEAVTTQLAKSLCRSLASTAGNHALGIADSSVTTSTTRTCTQCASSRSWCWFLAVAAGLTASAGLGAVVALYWMGVGRDEVKSKLTTSLDRILGKSSLCAEARDSPVSSSEDHSPNAAVHPPHPPSMWNHHLPPWVAPLVERATTNVITKVERVGQKVAATIVPKILESNTAIGQKLDDKTAAMVRANFEASEQVVKQLSAQMARANGDIADRVVQSLIERPEIIAALQQHDGGGAASSGGVTEARLKEIVEAVAREERQQLKLLAKDVEVMLDDLKVMHNQPASGELTAKLAEIDENIQNVVKEVSAEVGEQSSITFAQLERLNDNLESLNEMLHSIATAEARHAEDLQRLEVSIQEIKAEQTELLGEIKDSTDGRGFEEPQESKIGQDHRLSDLQRSINLLKSYIYILSSAAVVGILLLIHNTNVMHQLADFSQDIDGSLQYVASSLGRQAAALAHQTEAVEALDQSVKNPNGGDATAVDGQKDVKKQKLFDDNWSYWTMTGVLLAWTVWLADEYLCGGKWTWVKNIDSPPPTTTTTGLENISSAASDGGGSAVVDAVGDAAVSIADTELSPDWSIQ